MNLLIKKKSKIHGSGIFTTKNIKKNSNYYNVPYNIIFNEPKPKCAFIGNNLWISDEKILNYVNHSCNPNSILDISDKPKLIALRDIKKSEEITVDYNKTEVKGIKIPCNCKNKNCKGYFLIIKKLKIGILGGIGPEASAEFYKRMIDKIQKLGIKNNTMYPHIILESIPAPELFLDNPDLTMYKEAIINLEKAGADFIVIVCNTAYTFLDKFKKLVKIPIINLNHEVEKELKNRKISSVIIFGSGKIIDKLFKFENIKVYNPSKEDSNKLDEIIFNYNTGIKKELQKQILLKILDKYNKNNILIACTELSSMINNSKYFDTFEIMLDATIKKWNEY